MRILWFVNSAFPAVRERLGLSDDGENGWWMIVLGLALTQRDDLELGVAWASPQVTDYEEFESAGVTYYCLPANKWAEAVAKRLRPIAAVRKAWRLLAGLRQSSYTDELDTCLRVVRHFQPDVVHIHGTENFYGLLTLHIHQPVLISLQGILTMIVQAYWGSLVGWRRLFYPEEILAWWEMRRNARREQEIFHRNVCFTGRTSWDQIQQTWLSSNGYYYSCQEMMRPIFYQTEWTMGGMQRHVVYTTTTPHPYKGTDYLIDAIALLRRWVPDVQLRIGGPIPHTGFAGCLRQKVRALGLENNVHFLGYLRAGQIAQELERAHAYVIPSYIENSPNGLAEAQLVGVPCVASYTGGIPSLVSEGETGLLFPRGDAALLAMCLRRIFDSDSLAIHLSHNARAVALKRHDRKTIVETLLSIYQDVIWCHGERCHASVQVGKVSANAAT
jgi:glycosyltransferase involved in cell wall biosynthesis